ncbi:hypothetical protein VUR80DRAFT_9017 [Thermomyces stellatus]
MFAAQLRGKEREGVTSRFPVSRNRVLLSARRRVSGQDVTHGVLFGRLRKIKRRERVLLLGSNYLWKRGRGRPAEKTCLPNTMERRNAFFSIVGQGSEDVVLAPGPGTQEWEKGVGGPARLLTDDTNLVAGRAGHARILSGERGMAYGGMGARSSQAEVGLVSWHAGCLLLGCGRNLGACACVSRNKYLPPHPDTPARKLTSGQFGWNLLGIFLANR